MAHTSTYPLSIPCYSCGVEAPLTREMREVPVGRRRVMIEDEFYRCAGGCGADDVYLPGMMDESLRRATAKVREEDGLLTPEHVRRIRTELGLTQPEFERLLGVGTNVSSRWETGTVPQSAAVDSLLRLLDADRENARRLAQWHGVRLSDAA
jgi:putative zinc finger/helix-turn-helix YgiT family protein